MRPKGIGSGLVNLSTITTSAYSKQDPMDLCDFSQIVNAGD